MGVLGGLAGDGAGGVLGLALEAEGGGAVEVDFGVDAGSLLGLGALGELLGDRRCFCWRGWVVERKGLALLGAAMRASPRWGDRDEDEISSARSARSFHAMADLTVALHCCVASGMSPLVTHLLLPS